MEPFRNVGIFSESLIQKSGAGSLKSYSSFWAFLVDFHSARLFFAYYGFLALFWAIFWFGVGWGMSMGQLLVFALFAFLHFGLILALFWHFLGFIGHLGILRVLVSYKVTRGTILVVGAVHNGFWGVGVVQGRFGRVLGGSKGGLF